MGKKIKGVSLTEMRKRLCYERKGKSKRNSKPF